MYIQSLPRSRRSRNRRRSGRWVRAAILDRQWVAPNATIGLYLLDDKRRETERAVDRDGEPIALAPSSSEFDLLHAIRSYGEGRYRLVARNRRGHILARRDFVAAIFAHRLDAVAHEPRTEVERLKAELDAAREEAETARAERDTAQTQAEALKETVAERDAEIAGLEAALDQQGQALRRARRLYAELGNTDVDVRHPGERSGADYAEHAADGPAERGRRERTAQLRPRTDTSRREVPDGGEPKLFGLGRAEMKEIAALVKEVLRDQPDSCADTDEPGGGEQLDGDRGAS